LPQTIPTHGTTTDSPARFTFRADIEGLRGVAVLLVVACHCGLPGFRGGFIGVDVFFVLSGYLITGLLEREISRTSRIDLVTFYARRARRLLPSCALMLVATMLAAISLSAPQETLSIARAAFFTSLNLSNVFFDCSASDYFAADVMSNPLLHTWSLGIEEQFYAVWPALLLLARRKTSMQGSLMAVLSILLVLSFVCSLALAHIAPIFAFYELPSRAWEFCAGGLLALASLKIGANTRFAVSGAVAGFGLLIGATLFIRSGQGFPGWIALLPVGGTLALLQAGASTERGPIALLRSSPLQFLGARSYSWYLWHWPFIVFATAQFPTLEAGGKALAAIAALIVATIVFRYLERPIRQNSWLQTRPKVTLISATSISLAAVIVAFWANLAAGRQIVLDHRFEKIAVASRDVTSIPHGCWGDGPDFGVKICTFGSEDAPRSVVLFGDSHAIQWVDALLEVAKRKSWRLITLLRPGCPASDINPHRQRVAENHCREWRVHAIEKIVALQPSLIVMASYNGATVKQDDYMPDLMTSEEVRDGTEWTVQRLQRATVPIVILRDTPIPPFNIPACLARREMNHIESCDFDTSKSLNTAAYEAEREASAGFSRVYLVDLTDSICRGALCPATVHEQPIYRDDNHLTAAFAASLAPILEARLENAVNGSLDAEDKR